MTSAIADVRVVLRAYQERTDKKPRNGSPHVTLGWPSDVLVFDTETTIDAEQKLLFGCWRHCRWTEKATLELVQEGLFYADDLPESDPKGYGMLRRYARVNSLPLMSRSSFCWKIFFPIGYSARALIVGFNLPFDLSRIAERWGEARGKAYGGFSLTMCTKRDKETGEPLESRWLSRVWLRINNSKQSFIQFATPYELDPKESEVTSEPNGQRRYSAYRGRFLDLRTFTFALTSVGYTLAQACEHYKTEHGKMDVQEHGIITEEYIAYCRGDVLATAELLEETRAEFDTHPIALDPCKAYSSAAIAKAYLRALGVIPPRQKFGDIPIELFGVAMSAYYGGRAEARIRLTAVPVIHTDFVSMYPTVNALMGLWHFVIAENLRAEEFTESAREILSNATPERYFERQAWQELHWFALVEPDGDILPVRAAYDQAVPGQANIGVNQFTCDRPIWYAGPDLIAAVLLGNKIPRIVKATRLIAEGVQAGLKSITLSSGTVIDPINEDFFRVIIEQRKRLKADKSRPENALAAQALKILANAGSYGISAECNPEELQKDAKAPVMVYAGRDGFSTNTHAPETAGEFSFPPFAALITSAARLMLALLETMVANGNGEANAR